MVAIWRGSAVHVTSIHVCVERTLKMLYHNDTKDGVPQLCHPKYDYCCKPLFHAVSENTYKQYYYYYYVALLAAEQTRFCCNDQAL